MKLLLIFVFGLLAVNAQSDAMKDTVEEIIENSIKHAEEILQKTAAKQQEIKEKFDVIFSSKIREMLKKVQDELKKIKDLGELGGIVGDCVKQHKNQFEDIKNQTISAINACTEAAKVDSIEIEREIWLYDKMKNYCVPEDGSCRTTSKCVHGQVKENPFDCTLFFRCDNGYWRTESCPENQYFNKFKNSCVPEDGSCRPTTRTPSTTTTTRPECVHGQIEEHQDDCTLFRRCVNGYWRTESCPENQYFDKMKNSCVPEDGSCRPTTTTPSTTTTTHILIFSHINAIYEEIENCLYKNHDKTIDQALCVAKKVKLFKDEILEAYRVAQESLKRLEDIILKVLNSFGKCQQNAENNFFAGLEQIKLEITQCVEENA